MSSEQRPPAEPVALDAVRLLQEIKREAETANKVISLNRDGDGSGRVKVATALHRIERLARAALADREAPAAMVEGEREARCGDVGAPLCSACSQPIGDLTQFPGCGGPLPAFNATRPVDVGATGLQQAITWLRERQADCVAVASKPDNDDFVQEAWVVRGEAYGFAASQIEQLFTPQAPK